MPSSCKDLGRTVNAAILLTRNSPGHLGIPVQDPYSLGRKYVIQPQHATIPQRVQVEHFDEKVQRDVFKFVGSDIRMPPLWASSPACTRGSGGILSFDRCSVCSLDWIEKGSRCCEIYSSLRRVKIIEKRVAHSAISLSIFKQIFSTLVQPVNNVRIFQEGGVRGRSRAGPVIRVTARVVIAESTASALIHTVCRLCRSAVIYCTPGRCGPTTNCY